MELSPNLFICMAFHSFALCRPPQTHTRTSAFSLDRVPKYQANETRYGRFNGECSTVSQRRLAAGHPWGEKLERLHDAGGERIDTCCFLACEGAASIVRGCCLWFALPQHEPAGGGAPHPLEIAKRRSPGRIVINQRTSKAWTRLPSSDTSTLLDHMKPNDCVPQAFTRIAILLYSSRARYCPCVESAMKRRERC